MFANCTDWWNCVLLRGFLADGRSDNVWYKGSEQDIPARDWLPRHEISRLQDPGCVGAMIATPTGECVCLRDDNEGDDENHPVLTSKQYSPSCGRELPLVHPPIRGIGTGLATKASGS